MRRMHCLSPSKILAPGAIAFLSLLWFSPSGLAEQPGDVLLGDWYTAGREAKVRISRCGAHYCGKIVWLKIQEETGEQKVDKHNPDENLRKRPLVGLEILRDVRYDGDSVWSVGRLYDPENGKEYKGKAKLKGRDNLVLRGYVLIPFFGRSVTWVRADH